MLDLLRSVIDKSVSIANDILDNEDSAIITGYLQGKSTKQIVSELNLPVGHVYYKAKKSMPILLSRLDYSDLRDENRHLNEKLASMQEEIAALRARDKSRNISRKIQGTPFALGLSRFGFPVRLANTLANLGCKNLADVLALDLDYYFRKRKISPNSMRQLDSLLAGLGLYAGMNLDAMSDSDFAEIVENLKQKTGLIKKESVNKEHLKAYRENEKELKKQLDSMRRELDSACRKLSEQQETIERLVEEIKNLNEFDLQIIKSKDSDSNKKIKAVYEYKLESMNIWKKTLEADLAASRSIIKAQKAIIEGLQLEQRTKEEKELCTRGVSSQ